MIGGGDIRAGLGDNFVMNLWHTIKSVKGGRFGERGDDIVFDDLNSFTHPSLSYPIAYAIADLAYNGDDYFKEDGQLFNFRKFAAGTPKGTILRRATDIWTEQHKDAWGQSKVNKMLMIASDVLGHRWYPMSDPNLVAHKYLIQILEHVEHKWRLKVKKYWILKARLMSKLNRPRPENLTPAEQGQLRWIESNQGKIIREQLVEAFKEVFSVDDQSGLFLERILRDSAAAWEKDKLERISKAKTVREKRKIIFEDEERLKGMRVLPDLLPTPTIVPGAGEQYRQMYQNPAQGMETQ